MTLLNFKNNMSFSPSDGTGVYGYSCDACDTPACDNLVYQLIDEDG